jgi:hypothetical protein
MVKLSIPVPDFPSTDWRAIIGPPLEYGRTTFGTREEAEHASEALAMRGYEPQGLAPVVAINDERLPQ